MHDLPLRTVCGCAFGDPAGLTQATKALRNARYHQRGEPRGSRTSQDRYAESSDVAAEILATTEGRGSRGPLSPGHKGPPPLKLNDPPLPVTRSTTHVAHFTPLGHRTGGGRSQATSLAGASSRDPGQALQRAPGDLCQHPWATCWRGSLLEHQRHACRIRRHARLQSGGRPLWCKG